MATTTNESIPMTALDAVNLMLAAIGSVLVPSLLVTDTNKDAEGALKVLQDTSREVQMKGWHWNREHAWPLLPDPTTGELLLPSNCLEVREIRSGKWTRELVERGGKLYDMINHTFSIGERVLVQMVVALPYEDLPTAARWYIAVKAARRFAITKLPSDATFRYTTTDEQEALASLEQSESQTIRDTMGTINSHVSRMRRR